MKKRIELWTDCIDAPRASMYVKRRCKPGWWWKGNLALMTSTHFLALEIITLIYLISVFFWVRKQVVYSHQWRNVGNVSCEWEFNSSLFETSVLFYDSQGDDDPVRTSVVFHQAAISDTRFTEYFLSDSFIAVESSLCLLPFPRIRMRRAVLSTFHQTEVAVDSVCQRNWPLIKTIRSQQNYDVFLANILSRLSFVQCSMLFGYLDL